MQTQTSSDSNHLNTVFFCDGCLMNIVSCDGEICLMCQAKSSNRRQTDRDFIKRDVVVLAVVLIIALIVWVIGWNFLRV